MQTAPRYAQLVDKGNFEEALEYALEHPSWLSPRAWQTLMLWKLGRLPAPEHEGS